LHDLVEELVVGGEQLGGALAGGGDDRGGGHEGLDQVGLCPVVVVAVGQVGLVAGHADHQVHPVAFRGVGDLLEGEGALPAAVCDGLDVQGEDLPAKGPAGDGVGCLVPGAAAEHLGRGQVAGHPSQGRGQGDGCPCPVPAAVNVGDESPQGKTCHVRGERAARSRSGSVMSAGVVARVGAVMPVEGAGRGGPVTVRRDG